MTVHLCSYDAQKATGKAVIYGVPFPQTRAARWLLPYGCWTCADGREILFNRRYRPIVQRCPGGPVELADPCEWVTGIVRQMWFYTGPHPEAECRERAVAALRAWDLAPGGVA